MKNRMRTFCYIWVNKYNYGMDRFGTLLNVAELGFESNDVGHVEN